MTSPKPRHVEAATALFTGAAGNRLVADVYGESGQAVLLLHGGGQTRHAWRHTAERLARGGATAYALDQRGHGDSEWVGDGHYHFTDFAADAAAVAVKPPFAVRNFSVIKGRTIYTLTYAGPPGTAMSADVNRFINSLLVKK